MVGTGTIEVKRLVDFIKNKVEEYQDMLELFEKHNEDFGKEYLEGKLSGLREVYYHILGIK